MFWQIISKWTDSSESSLWRQTQYNPKSWTVIIYLTWMMLVIRIFTLAWYLPLVQLVAKSWVLTLRIGSGINRQSQNKNVEFCFEWTQGLMPVRQMFLALAPVLFFLFSLRQSHNVSQAGLEVTVGRHDTWTRNLPVLVAGLQDCATIPGDINDSVKRHPSAKVLLLMHMPHPI